MGLLDILFGKRTPQNGPIDHIIGRPAKCEGYTINYSNPYWSPCPFHGCTTYQTVEEYTLCYCPKCRRLLVHNDDR